MTTSPGHTVSRARASPWFSAVKYCPTGSAWPAARVCLRASSTALAKSGNHGIPTPESQAGRTVFSNGSAALGLVSTVLIPAAGAKKAPPAREPGRPGPGSGHGRVGARLPAGDFGQVDRAGGHDREVEGDQGV